MLIEEFVSIGLPLHDATERAWESLLPIEEIRARENRRAFAHLIAAQKSGVARSVRKKGDA